MGNELSCARRIRHFADHADIFDEFLLENCFMRFMDYFFVYGT